MSRFPASPASSAAAPPAAASSAAVPPAVESAPDPRATAQPVAGRSPAARPGALLPLGARSGALLPLGARSGALLPLGAGAVGMACVGGSVAVSAELAAAPLFTIQALRYALACLLLLGFARLTGKRLHRPRGTEWLWLGGIAGTGLVIFNLALVQGARHAEPAVLGVAVAAVPPLLAAIGPLLEGRGPAPAVLAGAVVVTLGAGLVQGLGRTDGTGLAWAVVAFACEAAFTLLAVPVLGRHGPVGVSVHTTWLAAALLAVLGVLHEGPAAARRLTGADLIAGAYLAVAVTAVAFVLWYACVSRVGAGRAGLLTGIAPITAALTGVALGGPAPRPLVWVGIAVVFAGLAVGLRPARNPTAPADPGVPAAVRAGGHVGGDR